MTNSNQPGRQPWSRWKGNIWWPKPSLLLVLYLVEIEARRSGLLTAEAVDGLHSGQHRFWLRLSRARGRGQRQDLDAAWLTYRRLLDASSWTRQPNSDQRNVLGTLILTLGSRLEELDPEGTHPEIGPEAFALVR